MPSYVCLLQFKDQGIRNLNDTVNCGDSAVAEAGRMGITIVEEYWTMGAYDGIAILEAPDDETMSAVYSKNGFARKRQKPNLSRVSPRRDGKDFGED